MTMHLIYVKFSFQPLDRADSNIRQLGNISDIDLLSNNLAENCIPDNIDTMDVSSYDVFLLERRKMMAALIEKYYKGL